ncbi:MAG TPA: hypothetical protein VMT85_07985 [Thermoanaerobaculia bacterium]|nr:hypothetical protein [Thermoanaerobaculia bacterium]
MSDSTLSRRVYALLCLAVLASAGTASLGAVAITGGEGCRTVEHESPPAESAHHCLPVRPPSLEACRSAPCCALAPASENDGQGAVVSSPAGGEPVSPPPSAEIAMVPVPPPHVVEPEASPPSGRQRLALQARLLI